MIITDDIRLPRVDQLSADLIAGLRPGPYRDLYEAMDAVAFQTGGACEKSRA